MEHENTDAEFDRLVARARRILEGDQPPKTFDDLVARTGGN